MKGLATPKGPQISLINMLSGALLLTFGGCAQVQNIGSYVAERVSGASDTSPMAATGAPNKAAAAQAQQMQKLEIEKRALADDLQAAEQAALLVQVEGGDITLNKTADLPSCQTAKAAISGMPGREKQAVPPYRSAFSVGSVSPYTPHHLLISTCLPLAMVTPL